MEENGQIYFEDEIPHSDRDRLEEYTKKLKNAGLEKSGSNFVSSGHILQVFRELQENKARGSIIT